MTYNVHCFGRPMEMAFYSHLYSYYNCHWYYNNFGPVTMNMIVRHVQYVT